MKDEILYNFIKDLRDLCDKYLKIKYPVHNCLDIGNPILDKDFESFLETDLRNNGNRTRYILRALKEAEGITTPRELLRYGRRNYSRFRNVGRHALNEMDVLMARLNVINLWLES